MPRPGPRARRGAGLPGIPEDLAFATKPQIALEQMRQAVAAGIAPGVVVMDEGDGWNARLRAEIVELGS